MLPIFLGIDAYSKHCTCFFSLVLSSCHFNVILSSSLPTFPVANWFPLKKQKTKRYLALGRLTSEKTKRNLFHFPVIPIPSSHLSWSSAINPFPPSTPQLILGNWSHQLSELLETATGLRHFSSSRLSEIVEWVWWYNSTIVTITSVTLQLLEGSVISGNPRNFPKITHRHHPPPP